MNAFANRLRNPMLRIEYPLPRDLGYCALFHDFLTPTECEQFIALATRQGFRSAAADYPASYRNNDRLVLDDDALAAHLYEKIRDLAPPTLEDGVATNRSHWQLSSVNSRLRFCRYTANQQFNIHQDGIHHRSRECRSKLTFMIYLNDGAEFRGGDTVFFADGPRSAPPGGSQPPVVARVRPRVGTLILFDHAIWHAGETVTVGTKYIMRSDVLYCRCDPPTPDLPTNVSTTGDLGDAHHQGYIWTLASLDGTAFASGGRDCSIRLWDDALNCTGVLTGHAQSILGLSSVEDDRLASVARDRTLKVWDLPTRRCVHSVLAHEAAILAVENLGNGRMATAAADRTVKIWNCSAQELHRVNAHADWVWKLAKINDRCFASASEDGSVKVWHTDTLELLATLPGVTPLRTVAASPDGTHLATGDIAGRLRVWTDVETTPHVAEEFVAHSAAIRSVKFVDANRIASCGEDRLLKVWQGSPLRPEFQAQHGNFVTDTIVRADGACISCSYDGTLARHDIGARP